jgi:hypothetical protein
MAGCDLSGTLRLAHAMPTFNQDIYWVLISGFQYGLQLCLVRLAYEKRFLSWNHSSPPSTQDTGLKTLGH